MNDPLIALDRSDSTPVYRQIYARFRQSIRQGLLKPGDRVPSVRNLASELGIARGTVAAAYDLLTGEGYLRSKGPGGTLVAQLTGRQSSAVPAASHPQPPTPPSALAKAPLPFQLGLPALDAFPRKLWTRLAARQLRSTSAAALAYPESAGYPPLRAAIAGYLQLSRGIRCTPAQVFVVGGYPAALDLICRTLLRPQDQVWIEDPGYPPARQLLEQAGGVLVPVPVDSDGLQVDAGIARAPNARFALVTPSHQSPLGVSLALSRRLQLLEWAGAAQAWIIEDDYDGEYRYRGHPLPALKSLDQEGRVLYAGTFSKVLFPALRLAYLVVPEAQVAVFEEASRRWPHSCPALMQAVVTEFISAGHFARHLKKMRSLYAQRRTLVAAAFTQVLGDHLSIELQAGGMHLLARLKQPGNDQALARLAQEQGLAVSALSSWSREHDCGQGLLLSFTNIDSAATAEQLARRLRAAWRW